jgi:hypothetical protein
MTRLPPTNSTYVGTNYEEQYFHSHYGGIIEDENIRRLLGLYWYALFERCGVSTGRPVLDYGGGLGQVSNALPDATLFDPSSFAGVFVAKSGAHFGADENEIPRHRSGVILS